MWNKVHYASEFDKCVWCHVQHVQHTVHYFWLGISQFFFFECNSFWRRMSSFYVDYGTNSNCLHSPESFQSKSNDWMKHKTNNSIKLIYLFNRELLYSLQTNFQNRYLSVKRKLLERNIVLEETINTYNPYIGQWLLVLKKLRDKDFIMNKWIKTM